MLLVKVTGNVDITFKLGVYYIFVHLGVSPNIRHVKSFREKL
jgi:hypothetical protein